MDYESLWLTNLWLHSAIMGEVIDLIAELGLRGKALNPDVFFHGEPRIYRKTHPKFKITPRDDAYFCGVDFLTNQPLFRRYELSE